MKDIDNYQLFLKLSNYGHIRKFPKNHVLVWADTIPDYCYIPCKGSVCGYELLPTGEKLIYSTQNEYALFGESFVLTKTPFPITFETVVDSEILCISRGELLSAIAQDEEIGMALLSSVSLKFIEGMKDLRNVQTHSTRWRLCQLFINLAESKGREYDGKILIAHKYSFQTLSDMLGVNRTTIIRVIKTLKDMSLIENINGYYCVRDLQMLKNYQAYF